MGLPMRSAMAAVSVILVATTAPAALTPSLPTVDQAYPQSATVGASIESILEGNYLDRVQSVRPEDDELQAQVLESSLTRVRLRVSSRPDARPGLYGLRLITKRGISNIVRFRLTGWESSYEREPNDRETQARFIHRSIRQPAEWREGARRFLPAVGPVCPTACGLRDCARGNIG